MVEQLSDEEETWLRKAQLEAASGALQVEINYQAKIDTSDRSRNIKHLNSIARGAYELLRERYEEVVDSENSDTEPANNILYESQAEWMLADIPDSLDEVRHHENSLESSRWLSHYENHELEIRKALREYEGIVKFTREQEIAELSEIEDALIEEDSGREMHIPEDDAVVF